MRKRCHGKPNPEVYAHQYWCLQELERLSEQGLIDLFYGDESRVSSEGYVPYGWQFPGEDIAIAVRKGYALNIFGLISRSNLCHWTSTESSINGQFLVEYLDRFCLSLKKQTFLVLDNASVHRSKAFRERLRAWQARGLFIFFLPPYSPHLNIAETLWRKLKKEWLNPEDYRDKETLFYAVNRCMANVGEYLTINFSPFNAN
ncbi:MAG: IS630 family transposase [Candidatus Kapaibacteriota bacterium]